jgi:uncharacterized membrane protein YqgA involved in biofilm formation
MPPYLGTLVNTAAVVAGSLVGMGLKRGVSPAMERTLNQALGLCVAFIGLSGTLAQMLSVGEDGVSLQAGGTMMLIVSMVVGTVAGQLVNIEGALDRFGTWLRSKVGAAGGSRFTEGFVTSSLIICVGAMAVVGGIADGMGQPQTLLAKSALDFVIVLMLASTLGLGVAFSALPILVYEGLLATAGLVAGNVMTDAMVGGLTLVGDVLVFAVGVNLPLQAFPGGHRIAVGNMLPALVVALVWEAVAPLVG